jgi:hypothetical protein
MINETCQHGVTREDCSICQKTEFDSQGYRRKQIRASAVIFAVMFPENQQFQAHLPKHVMHCLTRAMQHCSGASLANTYPSTAEGCILPFDTNVS